MSIRNEISKIESDITILKSNDLDFENQVELYSKTLKKITKLNAKIEKISHSIYEVDKET